MKFILHILIGTAIVALFLYSKLLPHQGKLNGKYRRMFDFADGVFRPILGLLRKVAKPVQVGSGIAVDRAQMWLMIVLVVVLIFIL
jgi:hypothetical protein